MYPLWRTVVNRALSSTYNSTKKIYSYSTYNCRNFVNVKQRSFLVVTNQVLSIPSATMSGNVGIKPVNYQYIKALKDNKDVLLIDVREPSELQEKGVLPGSINIPLDQVETVLKNSIPEEFAKKYGHPKPDLNTPLVFSCYSGRRSLMAAESAAKLGYKNISNYQGGWSDWEQQIKQNP